MRSIVSALALLLACAPADGSDAESASTTGDPATDGGSTTPTSATSPATMTTSPTSAATDVSSTLDTGEDTNATDVDDTGVSTTGDDPLLGCANLDLLVCTDFEAAEIGGYPQDWDKRATGTWLGNTMGVSDDDAYRGAKSLRIAGGESGAQWLSYTGDLGELATAHWGRMFVRVQVPAPWPSDGVLHGDVFEARGPYGENNTNNVRWGIVENTDQHFQWIYNVQRSTDEFGTGTEYVYEWDGEWFCMEWHHDQTTQEATLWLDGIEVEAISQTSEMSPEIPVFDDISVGWANYQIANPEFVVHIDEVALDDERIGCDSV